MHGLLIVVLENVTGIIHTMNNRESVMECFLRVLRMQCPEFHWGVEVKRLQNYLSPQMRVRVFLIGMRKLVPTLPKPLPHFGTLALSEILGNFPCIDRHTLSKQQQINLVGYERALKAKVANGSLQKADIVIISVDRASGKTWLQKIHVNKLPTLTTNSQSLMVISVGDVCEGLADCDRKYFRKLHNAEKMVAQGFPKEVILHMSYRAAQKAAGNAYPVALIIAVLHPLLHELHKVNFDLASWPPPEVLQAYPHECLRVTKSELAKPRKKRASKGTNKKRKHNVAGHKRCRCASSDDD